MVNQYQKKVLVMALFAGELMMKSGAEAYRVEETIERICRACRIDYVECFAITTGIFLSIDSGKNDEDTHTFVKRINNTDIDLDKISQLNNFSRQFTTTDLSIDEGFQQLKIIAKYPTFSVPIKILGAIMVGLTLCFVLGGGVTDSLCAGVIGGCIYSISMLVDRLDFPKFIRTFVGCAICALMAIILYELGICEILAPVITASMSIYLPGVAITNAARDMLSGDMLSGVSKFAEAILLALGIAGGVGLILKFYSLWFSGHLVVVSSSHPLWIKGMCAIVAVLGFCILFNSPRKTIPYACIVGAMGQIVMQHMLFLGQSPAIACFTGACTLALLSELGSRAGRDATTIFIIPGIIPLVPGSLLYSSMLQLLEGDMAASAALAFSTLLTTLSIAAALVVVSSLTRLFVRITERAKDASERKAREKEPNETEDNSK